MLQLGSCLSRISSVSYINLGKEIFLLAQRTPSWGIPLGISIYIAHKTGEELLLNCPHLLINCSCYQFLLTHHYLVRFYCQYLVDDKTFFLLFTDVGSSWLESAMVLFLLLLKWDCRLLQVTTSFLVLLSGPTYSHKDFSTSLWHHLHNFVFSVLLEGIWWRGIVPSHTIATRDTYFSHANLPFPLAGGGKGMARHFGITVSCCPATPVYETLWGCACDNAYTCRWHPFKM